LLPLPPSGFPYFFRVGVLHSISLLSASGSAELVREVDNLSLSAFLVDAVERVCLFLWPCFSFFCQLEEGGLPLPPSDVCVLKSRLSLLPVVCESSLENYHFFFSVFPFRRFSGVKHLSPKAQMPSRDVPFYTLPLRGLSLVLVSPFFLPKSIDKALVWSGTGSPLSKHPSPRFFSSACASTFFPSCLFLSFLLPQILALFPPPRFPPRGTAYFLAVSAVFPSYKETVVRSNILPPLYSSPSSGMKSFFYFK